MKRTLYSLLMTSVLCLVPFLAKSQSTMEFQTGTTIEVQSGADICADIVQKNGTTSGSGTQCGGATSVLEVEVGLVAKEFKLDANYPNPFNPSTTIRFTLAEDGKATLRVFNMLGQEVAKLFDGEAQAGRLQQVKFDASTLPSGSYVAKLEAGGRQVMQKMVLMK